jgi:hypothetical protein
MEKEGAKNHPPLFRLGETRTGPPQIMRVEQRMGKEGKKQPFTALLKI